MQKGNGWKGKGGQWQHSDHGGEAGMSRGSTTEHGGYVHEGKRAGERGRGSNWTLEGRMAWQHNGPRKAGVRGSACMRRMEVMGDGAAS